MQFQFDFIDRRAIAVIVWISCVFLASCGGDEEIVSAPDEQIPPPGDEQMPTDGNGDVPNDDNDIDLPKDDADEEPDKEPIEEPDEEPDEEPIEEPVALPGLPDFTAGYDQWLRLNAGPIPPNNGPDPHRGTKNVYVNQERAAIAPGGQQAFPYPDGCIVVKDSIRPDKDFVGLVAIMQKTKGVDPAHNDWVFEEYTRNAADAEFNKIADGAVCWNCHSGVADTDYVFTPLE